MSWGQTINALSLNDKGVGIAPAICSMVSGPRLRTAGINNTVVASVYTLSDGKVSVPAVDAIVTCSDDKKIFSIALVNKDPQKEAECNLGMEKIDGVVNAEILSGDSPDAFNDVDRPVKVVPQTKQVTIKNGKLTIPAHSLVMLTVNRDLK